MTTTQADYNQAIRDLLSLTERVLSMSDRPPSSLALQGATSGIADVLMRLVLDRVDNNGFDTVEDQMFLFDTLLRCRKLRNRQMPAWI